MRKIIILSILTLPSAAYAQEINQANTAWVLTSTALVLFMTLPGLSLFYAGLVRAKNVLSVMMQCFAITCLVSILWLTGIYSLIFTDGGAAQALAKTAVFLKEQGRVQEVKADYGAFVSTSYVQKALAK